MGSHPPPQPSLPEQRKCLNESQVSPSPLCLSGGLLTRGNATAQVRAVAEFAPDVVKRWPLFGWGLSVKQTRRLRWDDIYSEAELYKSALRVYTKPLFAWRKALCTSTDGRTLYDLARQGLPRLEVLHRALRERSFQFRPALALHYNFDGKRRAIYLSPWEERIADLLLYRSLVRKLHSWLSPRAFAYRARGFSLDRCQSEIARVLRRSLVPLYVVKRDIADYFASVDHELLLAKLRELVDENDYLFMLLEQRVRFAFMEEGQDCTAEVGIPFGAAIACLFANVYLTELDRRMEAIGGISYYRYSDDILVLAADRNVADRAREVLESTVSELRLKLKPSHSLDLFLGGIEPSVAGALRAAEDGSLPQQTKTGLAGDPVKPRHYSGARDFRHLGLLFRGDGEVALSRDKLRKIQNLFRFAFRRSQKRWRKLADPLERAAGLVAIASQTIDDGVRNVAIVDYYLKHVTDERQLRLLDRWLAEEVLSRIFGGHKKAHFRRISYEQLRELGLPSLVHRRRLILSGRRESPFFLWQQEQHARAFRGTVARPRRAGASAFSPFPEAAAIRTSVGEDGCL